MNLENLLQFLIENGSCWVQSQREAHRPSARTLSEEERSELRGFFESEILDRSKVKLVPFIENPRFYPVLRGMGMPDPIDFSAMSGITFVDTILISELNVPAESQLLPLLFHELVHVVQYEILGLRAFVESYVRGWAENGFNYFHIPIERHAYELQESYEAEPHVRFSVTAEVHGRAGSY